METYPPRNPIDIWSIQVTPAEGATVDWLREAISAECNVVTVESLVSDRDTQATFSAEPRHDAHIDRLANLLRTAGVRSVSC